jgi:hypothetical protein
MVRTVGLAWRVVTFTTTGLPRDMLAKTPGMTVTARTVWSRTTHPTMPSLAIEPTDMGNLIAYILSLRDR